MNAVPCMTPHLFPSILVLGTWCCTDKMRVEEPEPGSREFLPLSGAIVFRGSTPEAAYAAWYFAGEADGMGSN